MVEKKAKALKMQPRVVPVKNPRIELEDHYYNPIHEKLLELGYKPTVAIDKEIEKTLKILAAYKDRILRCKKAIKPKTRWEKRG
jgi:hypothetical protein